TGLRDGYRSCLPSRRPQTVPDSQRGTRYWQDGGGDKSSGRADQSGDADPVCDPQLSASGGLQAEADRDKEEKPYRQSVQGIRQLYRDGNGYLSCPDRG